MYFEEDMNNLLKDVPLPITIMFDEIEAITFSVLQGEDSDNLWVDGDSFVYFWSALKGYYSKYPKRISILVAGTNPMINEVPIIEKKEASQPNVQAIIRIKSRCLSTSIHPRRHQQYG